MRVDGGARVPGGGSVVLLCSFVLATAGCASSGGVGAGGATPGGVAVSPASSGDVLTGDEVRATGTGNVWDALRRLRPLWLQARGGAASVASTQAAAPIVYVGGMQYGNLRSLQSMNVAQVRRIEFVNARDATTRWGTGHTGGVILIDLDRE